MSKKPIRPSQMDPSPQFSFCESVTASGMSPWHIRNVFTKLKLTGGVDTPSLCGHVKPEMGGWDVDVAFTEHPLENACPKCVEAYRKLTKTTEGESK